jgi:hypothetical protein
VAGGHYTGSPDATFLADREKMSGIRYTSLMSSRLFVALLLVAALSGCRSRSKSADSCEVVEQSVKESADGIDVALSVRWTVAGKNYRTNKPLDLERFDASKHTVAELKQRYKVGAAIECWIDATHPTRVSLHSGDH